MSTVNIILSAYNGEKYIKDLITSIMNSNFADFVLHVFDDGSSDATYDIVESLTQLYPDKIRLYQNEKNLGSTMSFLSNLKLVSKESPAPYYMFCDQDDIWLNDKISISLKHIKKIEKRKGSYKPILVFNDAIIVNDNLEYISRSFYRTNHLKVRKHDFGRMLMENKCIGCTMMMNQSLVSMLDRIGPAIRYHDWWMALIASSFGVIKYIKTPTILYRQHDNNQVGADDFSNYVTERGSKHEDVKERLSATFKQAEFFEIVYRDRLPAAKRKKLKRFVRLNNAGFFEKRYLILRYKFFKSGLFRNLGLLFYI